MSAAGRNIIKFISGSIIGAGIGALISRGAESATQQGPEDPEVLAVTADNSEAGLADKAAEMKDTAQEKVTATRESLRDRWERARVAGDAAREAREAELRAYFREKVNDPAAFPPGAPTRTDT